VALSVRASVRHIARALHAPLSGTVFGFDVGRGSASAFGDFMINAVERINPKSVSENAGKGRVHVEQREHARARGEIYSL